jgi:hypothetical protein
MKKKRQGLLKILTNTGQKQKILMNRSRGLNLIDFLRLHCFP